MIILEPAKTRIANNQCAVCAKPKSVWNRRKDWRCCSKECTENWGAYVIYGWPDLRLKAFKRDNFTCVHCGIKPKAREYFLVRNEAGYVIRKEWREVDGINTSELIGDHIEPIAVGGDQWDLNNIQTLCRSCNKLKTKKDSQTIASVRKRIKVSTGAFTV